VLTVLVAEKADYDAQLVHDAIKGLGTNDDELIEVLCTRNNGELKAMQAAYMRLYGRSAEKDV
jgi:hypothetical protein